MKKSLVISLTIFTASCAAAQAQQPAPKPPAAQQPPSPACAAKLPLTKAFLNPQTIGHSEEMRDWLDGKIIEICYRVDGEVTVCNPITCNHPFMKRRTEPKKKEEPKEEEKPTEESKKEENQKSKK